MMSLENSTFKVQLARTLWHNAYRARVMDGSGEYVATLRLLPQLPLDRSEVPENAPEARLYLIVLVEDAPLLSGENLTDFENSVSVTVMEELAKLSMYSDSCQFVYPNLTTELELLPQQ
ncbi:MAG: hypothetical protein K0Q77_2997 [Anaerosporomusa subterranea]|jgi:hypothetical protein|nr:hypothetical protein [Anaerosporomusa subterranea]